MQTYIYMYTMYMYIYFKLIKKFFDNLDLKIKS